MRRRGGVGGTIMNIFLALIGIAIFLAILGIFQGDVFLLFRWLFEAATNFVYKVRDMFLDMPGFRDLFV